MAQITVSNTGATSPFQAEPHPRHPVHGRVTVLGRTVDTPDEWTFKDAAGGYWSSAEAELLDLPAVP